MRVMPLIEQYNRDVSREKRFGKLKLRDYPMLMPYARTQDEFQKEIQELLRLQVETSDPRKARLAAVPTA